MENQCIIERIEEPLPSRAKHFAHVRGEPFYPPPIYYRDKENGAEYWYLAGGIAWPSDTLPAYCLVMAVDKGDVGDPVYRALEERESRSVPELLEHCWQLQFKWGRGECANLFQFWSGDALRFPEAVHEFNREKERTSDLNCRLLINPAIFRPQNSDQSVHSAPSPAEDHFHRIWALLRSDNRRLHFGHCRRLQSELQTVDKADSSALERFPTITALAEVLEHMHWKPYAGKHRSATHYMTLD